RPAPAADALTAAGVTRLSLSGLAKGDVRMLVRHLAGASLLPGNVLDDVAEKTDGVPLFVEELTKAVLEAGRAAPVASLGALPIPTSLHDSLMARLDRLPSAKPVAQRASALGRAFSYALLRAVWPADE